VLVAQHQFVAILRAQGWRAPLIGTWTKAGEGVGTAPDGAAARWVPPPESDDVNEKGTWSSVWLADGLGHADVAMAAGVAGLGEDPLDMPLGPQGRHRLERLPALLAEHGLDAALDPPWLRAGAWALHLASGARRGPDGRLVPRDAALEPLPGVDDPGLGRLLAEARRCLQSP
jgi:hypothetical protein